MADHALLSPSSAYRWLHCTAAPLLEKDVPDEGSAFAEEGTLAHAYCAKKLKQFLKQPVTIEDEEIAAFNAQYHTGEMDEATDTYKTIVLEKLVKARKKTKDARLLVEVRLDFSHFLPESFGTSDAVIIADGCMEVIDFKYGKGVRVSAERNPQMMIYALGAYETFDFEYDIQKVRMTIVQPRLENLSEFEMSVGDLQKWKDEELRPKAMEAFSGKGKQVPGDWCRFCKVKGNCRALAATCKKIAKEADNPALLSSEDLAKKVLPKLPLVKAWLSSVEEFTLKQALEGTAYDGFKLVAGRSIRKITDREAVIKTLYDNGYEKIDCMKPPELKSITDLEKMIGKKKFNTLCADYIIKPQGKPALVPDSDKRPAWNPAQDDFKNVNV